MELFNCPTPWTFQGYIFNSAVIQLREFLAAKDLHTRNLETNRNLKQKEKLHIKSSTSEDLAGFFNGEFSWSCCCVFLRAGILDS